nr:copia protein [Tanacetum cinerariifolium]
MFSVCLCARFQEAPKTSHLEAVKRIFRYIKGTTYLRLWYPKGTDIETVVYADSDYAGDYVERKSTSGICTFVECCLTSWFSKKQTALAISTTESEYSKIPQLRAAPILLWWRWGGGFCYGRRCGSVIFITRDVDKELSRWNDG